MPVVFREGGYRVFFFSNEGDPREPMHVHVKRGAAVAKIWIEPELVLADSNGFNAREQTEIIRMAVRHRSEIEEAWREHFGD